MLWSKRKNKPISVVAQEIGPTNPRLEPLSAYFSFGAYKMPIAVKKEQAALQVAQQIKSEMLQDYGLRASKVFFLVSGKKDAYISGADAGAQLKPGQVTEALVIPEGCTWKPARIIPSAQKVKEMNAKYPSRVFMLDKYLKLWA